MNLFARITRHLRTHRGSRIIAAVAGSTAVLLALVTFLLWPRPDDPAAATVRDYLSAVRDGDVDAARGFENPDRVGLRDKIDTRFLKESALDADWSIDSVRSTGEVSDETRTAYVTAEISTADGEKATHTFTTTNSDGDWSIENPYVTISFAETPFRYLDVNDAKVNVKPLKDDDDIRFFPLFPGVYDFFGSVPDFVAFDADPVLLLSGEHRVSFGAEAGLWPRAEPIRLPSFELSKSGLATVQELVDDHIDDCATSTKTIEPGCPFGAEYVMVPDKPGYAYTDDSISDVKWKVIDYPVITAVSAGTEFAVADRSRGRVKLSATGETDGVTAESTAECEIIDTKLNLEVTDKDELRLYPDGGRDDSDDLDPDPINWNTCPRR